MPIFRSAPATTQCVSQGALYAQLTPQLFMSSAAKRSLSLCICSQSTTDGLKKTWPEQGKNPPLHYPPSAWLVGGIKTRNQKPKIHFPPLFPQSSSQSCLRGDRCPGDIVLIHAAANRVWFMSAGLWTCCMCLSSCQTSSQERIEGFENQFKMQIVFY